MFWHDPPLLPKLYNFNICIFCTLSKSFQQTVYERSISAYVSSLSNWGLPTIPLHVLTLQKDLAGDFQRHFSIFQRECQNHYYIRNDVKHVDFFINNVKLNGFLSSGVRPEWGIVLWFQSDIPLKLFIEFVQPHLTIK